MTHTVGIFVFDEVEVLDFAGPYEVFTTASRLHARSHVADQPLFSVFTIGRTASSLRARAGLKVFPDYNFSTHPAIDVLLIPGGVVTAELARPEVIQWIAASSARSKLTASICTGAFLLAQAGLLDGKLATTHWEDIDDLQSLFPTVKVQTNQRWIDEGRIVTSAGISAGIDMSLHLVERLAGRDLATRTARQMEFDWAENT
ncbi:MAG: DJ-1/PfpI family protein [Gallionellaceae bacterium]|nr:DJ-1/PfpI family protein [Gallionellaceae bacterium]